MRSAGVGREFVVGCAQFLIIPSLTIFGLFVVSLLSLLCCLLMCWLRSTVRVASIAAPLPLPYRSHVFPSYFFFCSLLWYRIASYDGHLLTFVLYCLSAYASNLKLNSVAPFWFAFIPGT
ncbi:unnamed protein product, partial [Pylaiella littoralis]